MRRTSTTAERTGTETAAAGCAGRARSRGRGLRVLIRGLVPLLLVALAAPVAVASPPFKPPPKRSRGLVRPTAEAAAPARVERVRYQADEQSTRVIVLLSRSVPYEVSVLPGEPTRGSERRVVLDFSNAKLAEDAMQPIGVEDGLLKQIRTGQFTARTARVVLDLASVTGHHVTMLDDPPRVVVDIEGRPTATSRDRSADTAASAAPARREEAPAMAPAPVPRPKEVERPAPEVASHAATDAAPRSTPEPAPPPSAAKDSSARRPPAAEPNKPGAPGVAWQGADIGSSSPPDRPAAPARAGAATAESAPVAPRIEPPQQEAAIDNAPPSEPIKRTTPWRVVLDPGHGGNDPGSTGVDGVMEKNVTLALAKRLKRRLEEGLGAQVLLTRQTDVTRSLAERTAFANASNADVFVSIHTNADASGELHGVETYTLNNTDDRAAIRLAKMENGPGVRTGRDDLSFILSDMVQSGKEEDSIVLANRLQQHLLFRLRSHYPDVRNLGVKKGPFYVLVGAYMPCVLVETSFLSHPIEGRRLASPAYQEDVVEGLYLGMADYLGNLRLAKTL